ncbi:EpsG family protein [Halomonas sp. 25-S5]|uniref:EpsG family protein n=1 Tax=Halomonas sp. 25-S5 TaxID=2994065 RepID=UPI0024694A26|nr:EpsG family protein [Halomonas sp. 25-S5]
MIIYVCFWVFSILASLFVKRKIDLWVFLFCIFLFVGLRFETGFDWPVYKDIFSRFQESFQVSDVMSIYHTHNQELGFLVFFGALAQILPSYEYVQAIFTVFLLYSFVKLASAIHVSHKALALSLSLFLSFFLLPVAFSTVRQSLAISFFNIALMYYISGRRLPSIVFCLLAILAHTSAIIYVGVLVVNWFVMNNRRVVSAFFLIFAALLFYAALLAVLELNTYFPPAVGSKISYYKDVAISSGLGLKSLALMLFAFLIGLHASMMKGSQPICDNRVTTLRNFIVVFSALAVASGFFTVLRDRIFYELMLLYGIYIATLRVDVKFFVVPVVFSFGLAYQMVFFLSYPSVIVFVPYQNAMLVKLTGNKIDGQKRSQLFMESFKNLYR